MKPKYINKLAVILIVASVALSACGTSSNTENNGKANNTTSEDTQTANTAAQGSGQVETASDPTAKFDPPIEFTIAKESDVNLTFEPGESYDNNSVSDAYEKDLRIRIKPKWIVDSKQYPEKVRLSIASNDIPELMKVTAADLQQLVENDMLADLTL